MAGIIATSAIGTTTQAKPVSTNLIGPRAVTAQAAALEVPTEVEMAYKATKKKFIGFVTYPELATERQDDDALGCIEHRKVALQKQVPVKNRRGRVIGQQWEAQDRTQTDDEGNFSFGPFRRAPSGKWRAQVAPKAYAGIYADLISCSAGASKPVNV